jgi:cytochrome c556
MKTIARVLIGSLVVGLAAAVVVEAADSKPAYLHDAMKNIVAIQAQVIWDVSNDAVNDAGEPDAAKLKAADWTKIANAAVKLRQVAQTYSGAGPVLVARPGEKIDGEGGTPEAWGARKVQGAIDANPAAFRAFANQMKTAMDEVVTATQTKNAAKLADVTGRLDQICEECHMAFWYPDQKLPSP